METCPHESDFHFYISQIIRKFFADKVLQNYYNIGGLSSPANNFGPLIPFFLAIKGCIKLSKIK